MIGKTVSHYRILEKLGSGGMGVVYKAEDTKLPRFVALKFLVGAHGMRPGEGERRSPLHDPVALERFKREARAASALNHPNIITIYDIDEAEGIHYIAMECVEGKTLDRLIARHGLRLNEALKYAVQMATALAKAHAAGIVHRDLKPTNVMVTDDGLVKVLDFGLAKLTEAAPTGDAETAATVEPTTEEGTIVGTVGYMSPEQAEGKPVDARSDIFSFGSVLYEMLTGQRAFQGETKASTIAAILREEPKPLSQAVEGLPREVERLVKRCLRKDPAHRFQHMDDLKVALEELKEESDSGELAETGVGAGLARPREGKALPYMRWALVVGGALTALASLLLGLNVAGLRDRLLSLVGERHGVPLPRIESLAVLPLENLSRDSEQEYFSDGMTDALIAELGQIGSLRVISRTSVMQYKGVKRPLPQIAKELNVDAVIEGSVLRSADRVRITAQLIGAVPERHLWARNYERDLRDVLTLQGEIARTIADEVKATVTPDVQARLARTRAVNPEAYEAYLRGRYFWNKRTEEAYKKAIAYFEQALEKDPAYALAYTGLADCYGLLADYGFVPWKEAYPRAKGAATKALELDEALAEAHTSLAVIKSEYEWDWLGAEREFKRAIELNPNYATAHHWYSDHLGEMGRHEEAIAEIKRAQQLDPLSVIINTIAGLRFHWARRYDEAVEQLRKTLEMDPNFAVAHHWLAQVYEQMGQHESAIAEHQKAITASGASSYAVAALGHAYAAGKRNEALRILADLNERRKTAYVSPHDIAVIHVALGEKDQAFEWLEKAYQEHAAGIVTLKVDPRLDPMRSDRRFQDLLRRMNLPL